MNNTSNSENASGVDFSYTQPSTSTTGRNEIRRMLRTMMMDTSISAQTIIDAYEAEVDPEWVIDRTLPSGRYFDVFVCLAATYGRADIVSLELVASNGCVHKPNVIVKSRELYYFWRNFVTSPHADPAVVKLPGIRQKDALLIATFALASANVEMYRNAMALLGDAYLIDALIDITPLPAGDPIINRASGRGSGVSVRGNISGSTIVSRAPKGNSVSVRGNIVNSIIDSSDEHDLVTVVANALTGFELFDATRMVVNPATHDFGDDSPTYAVFSGNGAAKIDGNGVLRASPGSYLRIRATDDDCVNIHIWGPQLINGVACAARDFDYSSESKWIHAINVANIHGGEMREAVKLYIIKSDMLRGHLGVYDAASVTIHAPQPFLRFVKVTDTALLVATAAGELGAEVPCFQLDACGASDVVIFYIRTELLEVRAYGSACVKVRNSQESEVYAYDVARVSIAGTKCERTSKGDGYIKFTKRP